MIKFFTFHLGLSMQRKKGGREKGREGERELRPREKQHFEALLYPVPVLGTMGY
jgi:hypothetical protein